MERVGLAADALTAIGVVESNRWAPEAAVCRSSYDRLRRAHRHNGAADGQREAPATVLNAAMETTRAGGGSAYPGYPGS
jgi:hypothetical protein